MKIKIINDVYAISKRIKNINKYYFICYDTIKNCYEIHNSQQIGGTFCLSVPYAYLDKRTLDLVQETSSANIEKILSKIDAENKLRESAEKRYALSQINSAIEERL